eukprot:3041525-Rhodomonas_salina.2
MPEASPFGAQPYRKGAWYEWGKQRHNMLDALGGTLDTDQDMDHPADLGASLARCRLFLCVCGKRMVCWGVGRVCCVGWCVGGKGA